MIIIINEENILTEGTKRDSENIEGFIITFYQHCLKYYYQKYKQGKSWSNSIIDNALKTYNNIYINNKKNINISRVIDNTLHSLYIKSISKANKETKLDIKNLDKNEYIFNLFDSIDKITNFKLLKDFLLENAYGEYVIEFVKNKYKKEGLDE